MDSLQTQAPAALNLRSFFILALLLGAAAIVGGQLSGYRLLSVIAPIAIMLLYVALGYFRGSAEPIRDQFADSIYYLGFLFTLFALMVSLYAFRSATLDIGQLVSNFALALSTTVVGLAVRIVINTFQSELPGLRKLMQNELDQAAIELTRNARNISLRLESVNEEIQTTFSESLRTASQGVQQSSETVEQQSQQALQGLVDAVDNAGKAMQQTVDEFRGRISAIHLPEDLLTETIGAPLERLGLRLDEVQKGLQQLAQQQTRTADDWGQAGKGVARLNTQLQLSEKAQLKLLQLVQQMMQYSDQVQQAVESMAQQSGHAQQTSAALDAMVAQVQPLSQQMATSMEQLQKSSALLHPLMQTMQQDLTAGQQVSGDMNHLAEGFADHSAQLLQSMQNNQQQLQQQLQEYQQTLAAVSGHFVEAARYVSERLKE